MILLLSYYMINKDA